MASDQGKWSADAHKVQGLDHGVLPGEKTTKLGGEGGRIFQHPMPMEREAKSWRLQLFILCLSSTMRFISLSWFRFTQKQSLRCEFIWMQVIYLDASGDSKRHGEGVRKWGREEKKAI